jgi:hypothetical protein
MSKKPTTRAKKKADRKTVSNDRREYPVRISKSGRKLTESQLEKESLNYLGGSPPFPEDYRRFLLMHNGGKPEPNYFVYKRTPDAPELDWVDALYPITPSENDPLNLRGANRVLARKALHWGVPYDCIAIGGAGGGHEDILLFVSGRRRGQVWIKVWDDLSHDADFNRDTNPNEGLYKLATSFDVFLEMLCTEEEAEQRVRK